MLSLRESAQRASRSESAGFFSFSFRKWDLGWVTVIVADRPGLVWPEVFDHKKLLLQNGQLSVIYLVYLRRTVELRSSNSGSWKYIILQSSILDRSFLYFWLWNADILNVFVELIQCFVAFAPNSSPHFWLPTRNLKPTSFWMGRVELTESWKSWLRRGSRYRVRIARSW